MEKRRLFRILAKADAGEVAVLAEPIRKEHAVAVVKEPGKTLAMVRLREPVRQSTFYLGEVIVSEAIVEVDGARGMAVTMGDDLEKALDMAVIDAACNRGVFAGEAGLLALEQAQREREQKENALHLKTMVNFTSMDAGEAAQP